MSVEIDLSTQQTREENLRRTCKKAILPEESDNFWKEMESLYQDIHILPEIYPHTPELTVTPPTPKILPVESFSRPKRSREETDEDEDCLSQTASNGDAAKRSCRSQRWIPSDLLRNSNRIN
ncbi:hypothetical protein K7432_010958 [Basidiobolus ranarum]|uniref:Uncharacterized protein n=1 Tax=Basidiobolus ranarum TaxID=34480 RepID=A0ABR2VUP8_9FUNG